jgi:hypothetical protein
MHGAAFVIKKERLSEEARIDGCVEQPGIFRV